MRNPLRRSGLLGPEKQTLPNYENREGLKEWAGLWELHRDDMGWWRPQHYYFRSALSGKVEQFEQLGQGPLVRPGPLRGVVHLDVPLAVLRSHPDTPQALPEEYEGMWMDTNPAWPMVSVDVKLVSLGLKGAIAQRGEQGAGRETYSLIPAMVDPVTLEDSMPFDPTPLELSATRVYVSQITSHPKLNLR